MKLKGREMRALTEYSAGALELGMSVAVGAGIGYALDLYFGTGPWLTLFWLLCGIVAGFRSLYRIAKRLERSADQGDQDGNSS